MPRRTQDFMELVRAKASMSAKITEQDNEYAWYSGASFEIAHKMATLDVLQEYFITDPRMKVLIKLYRAYLNQQRKAFFASVGSTEITKLGFILGREGKMENADLPF